MTCGRSGEAHALLAVARGEGGGRNACTFNIP